ncbi:DUF952 domain-containing protein [Runella slithyformis]|uniref:DUF952 domain-containing protein n=1 Tax=Runella slithyformis (strain ATCC 29530 / DSM 19594 / LMG 11500 / NCIMB 11436 / LSU 4) TaxID=761193 RepID=A0A7U3ZJI8_RUNSL|nr:DUF952 domain-containing protein [Runella slithyformis]AEI48396.1 protein of unknown function DUF952 [Runella slithyformis DSM 19594]
MIYHIVTPEQWAPFEYAPSYKSETFDTETFIHCSTQTQIAGVLERYYGGTANLLLMHIDESRLTSPLLYEPAPNGTELFPHVYGPINSEAIVELGWLKKEGKIL